MRSILIYGVALVLELHLSTTKFRKLLNNGGSLDGCIKDTMTLTAGNFVK